MSVNDVPTILLSILIVGLAFFAALDLRSHIIDKIENKQLRAEIEDLKNKLREYDSSRTKRT